jgi:SAM-dependent methyltransferase
MAKTKRSVFNKYTYYENSVQTPEEHVKIFNKMFEEIRDATPLTLREDFCGTFLISGAWAKSHPKRSALGLDLDPETLNYGKKNGYLKLKPEVRRRVQVRQQDVCLPTKEKFDVIGVGNFSFNVFHTREQLKKYFKAAYQSLGKEGILVLELAGGPGFLKPGREQKTYTVPGLGRFTYYWDQKRYDPINHHAVYSIHFKTADGVFHRDSFVYDWRIWSIPELKDALLECGFQDTAVYWESVGKNGEGTGEYELHQAGDNAYSWISFVVGIK